MIVESDSETPTLLLVAGTGRSGTSTAAGCLQRLGYAVPQPEIPADETNPRGFYEPQWVVDFHKRLFNEIRIRTNDARPVAVDLADGISDRQDLIDELTTWLTPRASHPRVVIKDPRTFWLHGLWRSAAQNAGFRVAFLTMLRPPVDVAKSRDQHYLAARDADLRRARETTNVAAWCHGILVTERVTRHDRRTFVPYLELMADWRSSLERADSHLGAGSIPHIGPEHHPIDDFVDPALNRSRGTWDDLDVHPEVQSLADDVWESISGLVEDPTDEAAIDSLGDAHQRYDRLYTLASDLTLDQRNIEREDYRRTIKRLRRKNRELQRRNTAGASSRARLKQSSAYRLAARLRRSLRS